MSLFENKKKKTKKRKKTYNQIPFQGWTEICGFQLGNRFHGHRGHVRHGHRGHGRPGHVRLIADMANCFVRDPSRETKCHFLKKNSGWQKGEKSKFPVLAQVKQWKFQLY